jgi:hypothetical protein
VATLHDTRMSITIAVELALIFNAPSGPLAGAEWVAPRRRPGVENGLAAGVGCVVCPVRGRAFSPLTQAVKFGSSCCGAGLPLIQLSKLSMSTKRQPRFLPGRAGAYDLTIPDRINRPASDREIGRS